MKLIRKPIQFFISILSVAMILSSCGNNASENNSETAEPSKSPLVSEASKEQQVSPFADGEKETKASEAPEKTKAAPNTNGASGLSNDLFSFEFILDDVKYTLPAPVSDFFGHGWTGEDFDKKMLDPNTLTFDTIEKGDKWISVTLLNFGVDTLEYTNCYVGNISIDNNDVEEGISLVLPKGIVVGCSEEELIAAYGQPYDLSEGDGYKVYTYGFDSGYGSMDSNAKAEFWYDAEEDAITEITLQHYNPSEEQANAPIDISNEIPENVLRYKAPAQLGDDPMSFIVKLDDVLYGLPAPLSEFAKAGWTFADYEGAAIRAHDSDSIHLFKGERKMLVSLDNYSDKATAIENCFVTAVEYDGYNKNVKIELPKGVTGDSSIEELLAAFGEPTEKDLSDPKFHSYKYGEMWNSIEIGWDAEEKAIKSIDVTRSPDTLN